MMLTIGGIQGLPGMDNVMDIVNAALRKFGSKAGWKSPEADVRGDIRDFIAELGLNPDLLMHGASRYSFGAPQVFAGQSPAWAPDALGEPAPGEREAFRGFDLSGSLSMGSPIPGIESLFREGKTTDKLWGAAEDIAGAGLGIPLALTRAVMDDHPDSFKRIERALPSILKSQSKAFHMATEGKVTSRSQARVIEFDIADPYHQAEIVGQALGFTPSRLTEKREGDWAAKQAVEYWQGRRSRVMDHYLWAVQAKDAEAKEEAIAAWKKYNRSVPSSALKINPKEMMTAWKGKRKRIQGEEAGRPRAKRYRGIYEEVLDGFPER